MAGKDFDAFKHTIERRFMQHPAVTDNGYTRWFSQGEMNGDELRHFTVQFSVFSNQFLLAALNRVINADSLEAARESKEILMNELGVIYNSGRTAPDPHRPGGEATGAAQDGATQDHETDPALVSTEGTVNGGRFRFEAAHFEWLLRFARPLGLGFDDLGKRRHGTPSTLRFCDELFRLYGSDDYNEAMGAAFAVENWAAAGFWKELIAGLEKFKSRERLDIPLAFFTWHDKIEDQHKAHVWDELKACYHSDKFREEPFVHAGIQMLDAVKIFWDGLRGRHPGVRAA
jgi:hypothetical protein